MDSKAFFTSHYLNSYIGSNVIDWYNLGYNSYMDVIYLHVYINWYVLIISYEYDYLIVIMWDQQRSVSGYRTMKNLEGKKTLANSVNYSNSPSFFANFYYFHNIPYANGLQFTKVFPPNFLQSLFVKVFDHQCFLLYSTMGYHLFNYMIVLLRLSC